MADVLSPNTCAHQPHLQLHTQSTAGRQRLIDISTARPDQLPLGPALTYTRTVRGESTVISNWAHAVNSRPAALENDLVKASRTHLAIVRTLTRAQKDLRWGTVLLPLPEPEDVALDAHSPMASPPVHSD